MLYKFIINNSEYKFDSNDNLNIPNFNWLMNYPFDKWETNTFSVFDRKKNLDKKAIDVGAWIGATTIWLSKNFKSVIAIEPDGVAIDALTKNLQLNDCSNVEILNKALTESTKEEYYIGRNKFLTNDPYNGFGNSTSQVKNTKIAFDDYIIKTICLSDLISKDVSLIKIDIEGGEEKIFNSLVEICSKFCIDIFISFHFDWWENKDLSRFDETFSLCKKITFENSVIENQNFSSKIVENPFGSFLIEF